MNYLKVSIGLIAFLVLAGCSKTTKYEYPFQNPGLSIEERVNDLVSRLTVEEKAAQLLYDAPAIDRLGIPAYNWWNECLHGVARNGLATVFPQAIGLAATFDTTQMDIVGTVISDEARAKYNFAISRGEHGIYQGLTFWTPNINIFRDPRWGRGMETYGEDPYLTGNMAVSFIKALQGNNPRYFKTIATSKHFVVHSGPEPLRHVFNSEVNDRDLHETYLPHFKRTVQEANVQSIMCAYNRLNGEPCCGSGRLLNDMLREDWGFKGYVVSDCWALVDFYNGHNVSKGPVDAAALGLLSGTDLNCGVVYHSLMDALKENLITEANIDISVKRLFTARFQLGMFDPKKDVPWSDLNTDVVDSKKHQQIALETARKSMVLLKNENKLLPLKKELKRIAVIGPNANDEGVLLGNYNGFPSTPITPLQGIKDKVSPSTEVLYARGCYLADGLPFFTTVPAEVFFVDSLQTQKGIRADFYNSIRAEGKPLHSEIHENIDANWWDNAPFEDMPFDSFSVSWNGYIVPQISGKYILGGEGHTGYQIIFNHTDTIGGFNIHHTEKQQRAFNLVAGKSYPVEVNYYNTARMASMKLVWDYPLKDLEAEALAIAAKSDVVLLFMGLSPHLEGEEMEVNVKGFSGGDRITLTLPEVQLSLMKKLKTTGKPMVLVLLNGSALAINWEKSNMDAILEAWYPGQAAGIAIADILFGDYNPAGRLPVTFYKSEKDLPPFEEYAMEGRTYRYFKGEPLYEFGYGLSYSEFEYSNLQIPVSARIETSVTISAEIGNISNTDGEEVVQVYLSYQGDDSSKPIRSLVGFKRISIKAGTTQKVSFVISPEQFAHFGADGKMAIYPGTYQVSIGGSQPQKTETKNVVSGRIELTTN